jgi:NDP-sugar pyrophosphorylase family protein
MKPTLLILAAGIGSRYGGLKQADSIGPAGEAIIEYSIFDAIRAGFGKVVIVIRKDIEKDFKEKFAGKFDNKIKVEFAFQEMDSPIQGIEKFPERKKPWGTGHAMLVAKDLIHEPFLVINADDFYGFNAFQKMSHFLTNRCTAKQFGMVGYLLKNTLSENGSVSRGVCEVDDEDHLTGVTERTKIVRDMEDKKIYYYEKDEPHYLSEDTVVSMNFWGFHPSVFETARKMFVDFVKENNQDNSTAEFYIPKIANTLIEKNKVNLTVMTSRDQWYGITYQEDKNTVKSAFDALTTIGAYPNGLWETPQPSTTKSEK